MEELTALSNLFGGTSVEVEASAAEKPRSGERPVLAVGDVKEEAQLYAHLTGRCLDWVESPREIGKELPDVIVIKSLRLDCDLVQLLTLASYGDQAPGVIWGRTREELRRQVLVKSAAAFLNGPVAVRRVDQWSLDGSLKVSAQGIARLREQIGQGAGVLTLFAHGDGVGQRLGSGTAICGLLSAEGGDASRGPRCLETDFCHRLDKPVKEAFDKGLLISPMAMSARVLVNTGCYAGFVGNPAVDSPWASLPGFVNNPRIGALMVNPSLTYLLAGPMLNELAKYLETGVPVGRAVVRFEENPNIRNAGCRMLLFGDPEVRAAPPAGPTLVQREAVAFHGGPKVSAATGPVVVNDSNLANMELVRLLAQSVRSETREQGTRTSNALVECIRKHEDALASLGTDEAEVTMGASLRTAVFQHLATTKVRLYESWQKVATVNQVAEPQSCFNCGWRARPREVSLPGGGSRLSFICPHCNDVMDVPLPSEPLGVSMSNSTIELPRRIAADRCGGAIFAVQFSARDTKMVPWPIDDEGKLASRVDLTEHDLPDGPVRIYAVIAEGLAIHSFGVPMRIGQPTPVGAARS
ncbi:MAG TPA: hypothetical protein VFM51_09850 [Solirubrobacterales bacterium]|nr:hypothetical protein [Solirubrobacterales bacterium]